MKFTLNWLERNATKNGKEKYDVSVVDAHGIKTDEVTIWKTGWPNFDDLKPGSEVEADLVTSQNGQFTNKTLFPAKTWNKGQTFKGELSRGSQAIAKAQERKSEMISTAQDNKELGIKISSTMRMAVDIVTSLGAYSNLTTEDSIKHWRAWLWNEWDKEDKDFPPFN